MGLNKFPQELKGLLGKSKCRSPRGRTPLVMTNIEDLYGVTEAAPLLSIPMLEGATAPGPGMRRHDVLYLRIRDRFYLAAIAARTTAASSSGSSVGGRQVKLVQTTATDFFSFSAGRFGIISASAGGKLSATASLSVRCTTDKLTA